jgi:hypothetical protein
MLLSKIKKKSIFLFYFNTSSIKKNTIKMLYNIKHLFTSPKKKKKESKQSTFFPHERSFIPKSHIARLKVEMLTLKFNLAISLCTHPNISTYVR